MHGTGFLAGRRHCLVVPVRRCSLHSMCVEVGRTMHTLIAAAAACILIRLLMLVGRKVEKLWLD